MGGLKLIIIGPEEAGKTLIANIIADVSDNGSMQYEPTEGVRILEVETTVTTSKSSSEVNAEVELWDCGGSSRYQSCWPVIQLDVDGVIFVHNPEAKEQLAELELLYDYFVIQNGQSDFKCLIIVNLRNEIDESAVNLPNRCKGVARKFINAASNPNGVKSEFHSYVETLMSDWKRSYNKL